MVDVYRVMDRMVTWTVAMYHTVHTTLPASYSLSHQPFCV